MKKYLIVFFERIYIIIIGFFITFFLVRFLSKDSYGTYRTILSYISIFGFLFHLSFGLILIRYLGEMKRQNFAQTNYYLNFFFLVRLLLLILVGIIIYLKHDFFLSISGININRIQCVYFFGILFFTSINELIGRSFYTADNKRDILAYIISFYKTFKLLIVCFLYFNLKNNKFDNLLLCFFVIELIQFIYFLFNFTIRKIEFKQYTNKKLSGIKSRMIRFGASNILWQSVQSLRDTSVDIAVITSMLNSEYSALYGVACVFPNFVRGFSPFRLFYGIIVPFVVENLDIHNKKQFSKLREQILFYDRIQWILFLPAVLIFILASRDMLKFFYGEQYEAAYIVSNILAVGIFFIVISDKFFIVANLLEKNAIVSKIVMFTGISNFILDIILVKMYGYTGVATATSFLSIITYLIFSSYFYHNHLYLFQKFKFYLLLFLINSIAVLPLFFVWGDIDIIMFKVVMIVFYFAVSLVVSYSLFLSMDDKRDIYKLIQKIRER